MYKMWKLINSQKNVETFLVLLLLQSPLKSLQALETDENLNIDFSGSSVFKEKT